MPHARKHKISWQPGHYYHIYNRGARQLCRYIHANPVKDGLVEHLEEWPYSNYLEWIGLRQGTLVDRDFIADTFPDAIEYEEFVRDYLLTRQLSEELSYLRIGDSHFPK